MTTRPPRPLDAPRFALLDRLVRRLSTGVLDVEVRGAVDVLTASADCERATRLTVRPDEPAPLVERLAVWALHRAPDDAVERAARVLDRAQVREDRLDAPMTMAS